jgi:integrase/recombinase XerD
MKKLDLRHSAYKNLLAQFSTHLQALNYSKNTVYNAENYLKEYLVYLQQQDIELSEQRDLTTYFEYLKTRTNHRTDGGLSLNSLHKHKSTLKLFYDFLAHTQNYQSVEFPLLAKPKTHPKVLSLKEIENLFKACDKSLLGKRNKAILALYYGLGLRKGEAVQLSIVDVDFEKEEVFIAQSKTSQQRIVPMSEHVKAILEDYVFNVREKLIPSDKTTMSLLVTEHGKPMSGETAVYTLKKLLFEAKIKTPASLHTLRHSIATHLLQSGMKLESIALFLGHKSLDSTQIYTHVTTLENGF